MKDNFYDEVVQKFGSYDTGVEPVKESVTGDPEKEFKRRLISLASNEKVALDIGCADGRFTLSVASHLSKIVAIDISDAMLKSAKEEQKRLGVQNVQFENQNTEHMTYADESFDIVYSRRGPTVYPEFARVLKPTGHYLEVQIGEQDCKALKETFGRGQSYNDWHNPYLPKETKLLLLHSPNFAPIIC